MKTLAADITEADIQLLIKQFYTDVRAHDRLGPIFHAHIGKDDEAWLPHLAKIADFWANVVRHERRYSGNPMQAHMAIGDIEQGDFAIWLTLFEEAARSTLSPHKADIFVQSAQRIGRSLAMGVARARETGPPRLDL